MPRYYFETEWSTPQKTAVGFVIMDRRTLGQIARCHSVDAAEKIVAALNAAEARR